MYDTNVLKSDDIIFRCKIILSFENIYKIFWKYMKDQEHPATTAIIVGSKKTARLKLEMFRINHLIFDIDVCAMYFPLPGGWVTEVGGAVTLDQVSILSATGSLENS